MPNSFATTANLTCPDCGQNFQADVRLIVDTTERPDLRDAIRETSLHDLPCPRCGQARMVDAPLLVFNAETQRRGGAEAEEEEEPVLIFSPASNTSAEQDRQRTGMLLGLLREALGRAWRDEWVAQMTTAPRPLLATLLADDPQSALAQMQAEMAQALERLRQEDPQAFAQMEEAARRLAEETGDEVAAPSPSAAAEGGLVGGEEVPDELRPLLEMLAALPEAQRNALARIFAQASSPEEVLAALEEQPELQAAVTDFLRDSNGFRIPSHFESDWRAAQEAQADYLRGTGLPALNRGVDAWQRILQHPSFAASDPRFRLTAWNDAGSLFLRSYWALGRLEDLDRALQLWQGAVAETPLGSPDRPSILNNLGVGLRARFGRSGRMQDLEEAIRVSQAAVAETPLGSPDRPMYLNNLGNGLRDRFGRSGRVEDLQEATASYRAACEEGMNVDPNAVLIAGRTWVRWAASRAASDFAESAQAGAFALDAIDALFGAQLDRAAQESWLKEAQGIHTLTAYALARQSLDDASSLLFQQAVESVERGQARLLAQALEENRADLVRLVEAGHAELYADYRANLDKRVALLALLEQAASSNARSEVNAGLRANQNERDGLGERIRGVPGYEDFLVKPSFARIAAALPHPSPPHIGEGAVGGASDDPSSATRASNSPSPRMGEVGRGSNTPHPSPPHIGEGAVGRAPDDPSSATLGEVSPSPRMGEVGRGFLVYLLATPAGGLALVVGKGREEQTATVTPVWLDGLTEEWLREVVYGPADDPALGGYLGAYDRSLRQRTDAARQGWFDALDDTCRQLWDVAIGPLSAALITLAGNSQSPNDTAGLSFNHITKWCCYA